MCLYSPDVHVQNHLPLVHFVGVRPHPLNLQRLEAEKGLESLVTSSEESTPAGTQLFVNNHKLTMCPKWIFVKLKVFSAGLDSLTDGWMVSLRNFSMYIPKKGQACSNTWTGQPEQRTPQTLRPFWPTYSNSLPAHVDNMAFFNRNFKKKGNLVCNLEC